LLTRSRAASSEGFAPCGPGYYFREVAAILDAVAGGPPDLAAIATVMRRHGLTPAP
jgi:hypothetical protein